MDKPEVAVDISIVRDDPVFLNGLRLVPSSPKTEHSCHRTSEIFAWNTGTSMLLKKATFHGSTRIESEKRTLEDLCVL